MKLEIDKSAVQDDLRKIGVAIVIASLIAVLLDDRIGFWSAAAAASFGMIIWVVGLLRRIPEEVDNE